MIETSSDKNVVLSIKIAKINWIAFQITSNTGFEPDNTTAVPWTTNHNPRNN